MSTQRTNSTRKENEKSRVSGSAAENASTEGFANHPHEAADASEESQDAGRFDYREMASSVYETGKEYGSKVYDRAKEIPGMSREMAGKIDSHARENPWIHVGVAGVAGLALGYLLGRVLTNSED